jgi:hypothetical protein
MKRWIVLMIFILPFVLAGIGAPPPPPGGFGQVADSEATVPPTSSTTTATSFPTTAPPSPSAPPTPVMKVTAPTLESRVTELELQISNQAMPNWVLLLLSLNIVLLGLILYLLFSRPKSI